MADTLYLVKLHDTISTACCKVCQCQNLVKSETNPCDEAIAEKIKFIIIAAIAIVAGALLLWFIIKRVADGIKWLADGCRKRKDAKDERDYNEDHKAEKELMAEKERLFVLKKEYQTKALNYIEEQTKTKDRTSCDNDTYLTLTKTYIEDIDERLKELIAKPKDHEQKQ